MAGNDKDAIHIIIMMMNLIACTGNHLKEFSG